MKKIFSLFITVVMLVIPIRAYCDDDIKVMINGELLASDVPPQIIGERTLVPMRAIFEALGAEVQWNGETQTVTAVKTDKTVKMEIGKNDLYINGEAVTLDVPPQIIDGRTLVPVRAVSESLGGLCKWDENTRTVTINTVKPKPAIEYDDTAEREAHYIRNFKIKDIHIVNNGYAITYTLETFLEGRGTVGAEFNCFDINGNVVDSFGGGFVGTDYTWSAHEKTAVISDKTVKISLILNNK